MKRMLPCLIISFSFACQLLSAQTGQWEIIRPASGQLPFPRTDAVSWADPKGGLYVFGGIGFDENKHWGIFRDMWHYEAVSNSWTLISGDPNQVSIPESEPDDRPIPRKDAASWVDEEGNLWLYGGRHLADLYHLDDFWKFDVKSESWTKVSGKGQFNQVEVRGEKKSPATGNNPGSRSRAISWTDKNGNLWLFGGITYTPEADGKNDYFNDLWMFDIASGRWQWVSGANKPNQPAIYNPASPGSEENFPTPRAASAGWYDQEKNKLWLYGGLGYDSSAIDVGGLSDLWVYDIDKDGWERKIGQSGLNKKLTLASAGPEHENNYPGYRISAVTWLGKNGDFFLAGGQSSFGRELIYMEKNVWAYSLKSGKWRILPQNEISIIGSGSGFTDQEGALYIFGGKEFDRELLQSRPSNAVRKIQP